MKTYLSLSIIGSFGLVCAGTVWDWDEAAFFEFQKGSWFRNVSGIWLFVLLLFQWGLSIGRLVYQASGARWQSWVTFHQALALAVPVSICLHSISLGYGLLAVLPLVLFGSLAMGVKLMEANELKPWLPLHLIFSALTMGAAFVHLWRVIFFR